MQDEASVIRIRKHKKSISAFAIPKKMKLHFQVSSILLLAYSFLHLVTSDLESDSTALFDFANTVKHARKLNWNQSISVCTSWIGITCTQDKTRVNEIHLPGFGLYGPLPPNTLSRLNALRVLSLRSNYLNGTLPPDLLSLPSLEFIFLQNNNFSGELPLSLPSKLRVMDLSFNSFSGEIPLVLGNLTRLSVLNLQSNSFHGNIPNLDLHRVKVFNLSCNSLSGAIPDSLRNFPASSFAGNERLCGAPLNSCSPASAFPSHESSNYGSRKMLSLGALAGACVVILIFSAIVYLWLKRKSDGKTTVIIAKNASVGVNNLKSDDFGSGVQGGEKNKLVFFEGCSYSFDLEDLLRASAEVLGKGNHGTTYKAILDESTTVVVKRLKDVGIGKKEFEQQMESVSGVSQHPNVVSLLAYYFSKDEKLLVYPYMVGGSLYAALHDKRGKRGRGVEWEWRLKMAVSAARGIAHIHAQQAAHGNIKSSNILLLSLEEACISDLMMSFNDQKSDVYSFGLVLLEMLTGKSPLHCSDLPRWVRSVVREEWTAEVFDAELTKGNYKYVEEEMVQLLQIGLSCVAKVADMRPRMDQVVRMIQDVNRDTP
ncbi:leucine-rich repeat protein kinase family protein [Striga asiatica]|uniref:Leucine-rich repeat protein kinase family protein n=1 Tax=Striga asiatica TaxID=4170 RepID=A0A5A7QLC4_STRAF|nr:leucine-rich repeat protein kinase family protein [Striga asiatica]